MSISSGPSPCELLSNRVYRTTILRIAPESNWYLSLAPRGRAPLSNVYRCRLGNKSANVGKLPALRESVHIEG